MIRGGCREAAFTKMGGDMSFDLSGRAAIITGAASGIGRAVAKRFFDHGARVAILDINAPAGDAEPHAFFQCDVSDEDAFADALANAVKELNGCDILVNNAGLVALGGNIENMDTAYFDRIFAVNTRGVMLGIKHGSRHISNGGAIINTASLAAFLHEAGAAAYHASKAAVVSLTRAAAIELGARSIRVNAVCPGHTRIDSADVDDNAWSALESLCKTLSPLGRLASVDEQIGAFHFLAAEESRFMTGQALIVDGGFSLGLTPALYDALGGQQ